MQFLNQIKDLCEDNQNCKKEICQALHPRIFVGICIPYLHNKCNMKSNCQLKHVNEEKLKELLQRSRINGVFQFNLCKEGNTCTNSSCQFLHREWMNNICPDYFQANCVEKQNCNLKHIYWHDLTREVYKKYNQEGLNPENYDPKNINHIVQNSVCTDYFEGICPYVRNCPNINHIDWEDVGQEIYLKKTNLVQCTQQFNKTQNGSIEIKNTNFIDHFFERLHNAQLKRQAKQSYVFDVLFIIDCTGSMNYYKNIVQQSISTVLNQCTKLINDQKLVRAAVVGYRDFDDDKQIEYRGFTNNHNLIHNFVQQLEFKGGNDDPENLLGGLQKAIRLDISKHKESLLFLFLFCDSPSHGPYHQNLYDLYRDTVQEGQIEKIIEEFYDLKKDKTFFICLKFTDQTDYMYQKIKDTHKQLIILEANNENLSESLSQKIEGSYQSSKIENLKQEKKIKARFTSTTCLKFEVCDSGKIDYWKKFLVHQKENQSQEITMLIIQEKCMELKGQEKGNNCVIFQGFDILRNSLIVIKIPKYIIESYNQKIQLTDKQEEQYKDFVDTRYLSLLIAQQLAHHFRIATQNIQEAPPIFFASPIKYILDEPFFGRTQVFAESYINRPNQKWQKYTNNTGYSSSKAYHYTAFSHFTYQMTGKQLVITDLQGKENVLSDPVIHTLDNQIKKILHDQHNFSQKGLDDFFIKQHPECHKLCSELKLCEYDRGVVTSISEQQKHTGWTRQSDDNLHGICEICGEFTSSTYENYQNQKTNMICENCKDGQLECIDITCQCCLNDFSCQINIKIKNLQLLEKCQYCNQQCIEGNQIKCLYCDSNCKKRLKQHQIEDQKIIMCLQAQQFLSSLKCYNCKALYKFEIKIEKENYEKSFYLCLKCQQKNLN